tara:strand:- start:19914 stop:21146 length:1233 start_codon:yes stop_codon:yes gene_type:complete
MPSYTNPFTGQTINPAAVGYESLSLTANISLEWPINGIDGTPASNIIDVTATSSGTGTGWLLQLPPAAQVSTGQSVIVRNVGANSFTVADYSGNTIVTVTSGVAQFVFLTDNTTTNGVWQTLVFGAGTSAANASALAGYGLLPIGLTLNQALNITAYTSNTVLTATSRAQFNVWNGGAGTFTLPSASTVGNNWFTIFRNNGSGVLTLTPVGTDTIDGNINQQLQLTESLVLVSNGSTGYNSYAYGRSNQFAFTQLAQSVTGGTLTLTSAQGANIIQEYSGALTSNQIVVLPSTVQLYSLQNSTTGAFTLTFKTAAVGAATVVVNQGQTAFVVCDGTNVYSTTTNTVFSPTTLTLSDGTLSTPSINFVSSTSTGMWSPASSQIGWVLSGVNKMTLAATGLAVVDGISGGTF